MQDENELLNAAIGYAGLGWAVHPLKPRAKEPATPHGCYDATTDTAMIRKWWAKSPNANIGIEAKRSHLVIFDIDTKGGVNGWESWRDLKAQIGPGIENTVMVATPTGGGHVYYKANGQRLPNLGEGELAPGIGVRAVNQYVVAPPSIHPDTGTRYEWDAGSAPDECELQIIPEALARLIIEAKQKTAPKLSQDNGGGIIKAERNNTLTSLAGTMRRRGMGADAMYAALSVVNQKQCSPPLDDAEVRKIAASVARYEPEAPVSTAQNEADTQDAEYRYTDLGNAEMFARLFSNRVRYDYRRHRWLLWSGHRWQEDIDNKITRYAVQAVKHRHHVAVDMLEGKERGQATAWAISSENANRIRAMQDTARALIPIATAGNTLDANPMLLGCNNGVVDLRTGELRPGDPADMITMSTALDFDENAECPRWLQFLDEVFQNDAELIAFIQRAVGYSICGDIGEQCLFLCHGGGSNGKSTFLNVLRTIAGDYGTNTAFSTFELRERSSIPNDIAALVGSRLITASETSEARRLNEARIKAITGGDPVTCRFLHGEYFTYQPTYKVWLAMNHKPTIQGTDNGIWRRIRLIPFNVNFEAVRDNTLERKLLAEAQGILRWAVEGCLLWQVGGLAAPTAVTEATAKYREESDIIGQFLAEKTLSIRGANTRASELFNAYKEWCKENNENPGTGTAFGNRLAERGMPKKTTRTGVMYLDLGLVGVETTIQDEILARV